MLCLFCVKVVTSEFSSYISLQSWSWTFRDNCDIAHWDQYYIELQKYYKGHADETNKKQEWTSAGIKEVIKVVEEYKSWKVQKQKRTTSLQYNQTTTTKYDILELGKKSINYEAKKYLVSY